MLALSCSVGTTSQIIEQLNYILHWKDARIVAWHIAKEALAEPGLGLGPMQRGLSRVTYYIQLWSYNADALVVSLWYVNVSPIVASLSCPCQCLGVDG